MVTNKIMWKTNYANSHVASFFFSWLFFIIISSHVLTKSSAIPFKYILISQAYELGFQT